MDNKAYLDQIAVKSKKATGDSKISPAVIKLFIIGLIVLALLIAVIIIFNISNTRRTEKFAVIYQRSLSLSSEESPYQTFHDRIKSSDLRQYNSMLLTALSSFSSTYASLAETAGFNTDRISSKLLDADSINLAEINSELDDGYLNGILDEAYNSSALFQVSTLIGMIDEALQVTTNTDVANTLSDFKTELTQLQKLYKKAEN